MAIEEEFSIEIPDKDADSIHSGAFLSSALHLPRCRSYRPLQPRLFEYIIPLALIVLTDAYCSRASCRVHPLPT